jgi:hypothetical protein
MKKSILLIFISFCSLGLSLPPKNKKINLVVSSKDLKKLNYEYLERNFNHEDLSGIFTYEVKEDTCCINPITEVYFEKKSLGFIYGIPNKDFLCQILPVLQDQILELDRIEEMKLGLDK